MTYNPNIPPNYTSTEVNAIEKYKEWILMDINGCLKYNQDPRMVLQGNQIKFRYASTAFNTNIKAEYLKTAFQNAFDCGACTQILVTQLATGKVTSITKKTENFENLVLAYQRPQEYSVTAFLSPQNPVSREIIDPLKDEFLSVSDNFSFPDALEFSMRLGPDQKKYHLNNALLMAAFLELDEQSGYTLRCFKKPQGNLVSIKCSENAATKVNLLSNFCIKPDAYTIVDVINELPIGVAKDPEFQLADGSNITLSQLRAKIQDLKTPSIRLFRNGEVNSWQVICKNGQIVQVARENAYGVIELSEYNLNLFQEKVELVLKYLTPMSTNFELGKCSVTGDQITHLGHTLNQLLKSKPDLDWDEITSLENGIGARTILETALNQWRRSDDLRLNFEIEVSDVSGMRLFKPLSSDLDKETFYKSVIDPDEYSSILRILPCSDAYSAYLDYVIKKIEKRIQEDEELNFISGTGSSKDMITMKASIYNIDIFGPYYPSKHTLEQIAIDATKRHGKFFILQPKSTDAGTEVLEIVYNKLNFPINIKPIQTRQNNVFQPSQPQIADPQQNRQTIQAYVKARPVINQPIARHQPQPQNITPQLKQPTQITTTIIPNPRTPNSLTDIIIGAADDGCFGISQYQNGHHDPEVKAAIDALGWVSTGYKNSNGLRNENYEAGQEWLANLLIHERFKNSSNPRYGNIYNKLNGQLIEPLAKHGAYLFGEVVYDPTHQIYISVLYNFTQGKDNMGRDIYFRRANWIVSKSKHDAQENLKLLTAHQQHQPIPQASPLTPQAQPSQNIYVGNKTMQLVNSNSLIQQNTPLDIAVKALDSGASGFIFGAKPNNTVQSIINYLNNNPIPDHRLNLQTQVPVNVAPNTTPNIANIQPSKPQNTLNIAGQTPTGKIIYCMATGVKAKPRNDQYLGWVSEGYSGRDKMVLNLDQNTLTQNAEDFQRWTIYDFYDSHADGNALPTRIDISKKPTPIRIVTGQIYQTDVSGKIMIQAELVTGFPDDAGRSAQYWQQFFVETTEQESATDFLALFVHIERNYPDVPSPFNLPNKPQLGQQTMDISHAKLQQSSPTIQPVKSGIYGGNISLIELALESIKNDFTSFIHGINPESISIDEEKIRLLTKSLLPILLSFKDSTKPNDTAQLVANKYPSPIDGKTPTDSFSLLRKLKKLKYENSLTNIFVNFRNSTLQTDPTRDLICASVLINYPEVSLVIKQKVLSYAKFDIEKFINEKPNDYNKCLKMAIYSEFFFTDPELSTFRQGLKQFISKNQPPNQATKSQIINNLNTILDVYFKNSIDFRPASIPKYDLKPKINNLLDLFTPWNLGISKIS